MEVPTRIQEEITIYNYSQQMSNPRPRLGYPPCSGRNKRNLIFNRDHGSPSCSSDEEDDQDSEIHQLFRLLECPVCKDVPTPPIYNCENGHFVCNPCRDQLISPNCGYCLASLTNMRNYPLETLVTTPLISCQFSDYGCPEKKLNLLEYEGHVANCWGKLWRPGRIYHRHNNDLAKNNPENVLLEDDDYQPCPKCDFENSPKKVKCHMCECRLRAPTPIKRCFDYQFSPVDYDDYTVDALDFEVPLIY